MDRTLTIEQRFATFRIMHAVQREGCRKCAVFRDQFTRQQIDRLNP